MRWCCGWYVLHIKKPALWGDMSWCFKNFIAIHMLAVCDHRFQFTYVDVGRACCVGDAFSYAESFLRRRIVEGGWLQGNVQDFDGTTVRPYIIGDSAFPLERTVYLASCRPISLNHCHYVVFCLWKAVEQGQDLGLGSMAHYHEQHHHHHFRQCRHYSLQGRKTGS